MFTLVSAPKALEYIPKISRSEFLHHWLNALEMESIKKEKKSEYTDSFMSIANLLSPRYEPYQPPVSTPATYVIYENFI